MSLAFCFSSGGLHFSNSSCSYETLFRVKILLQANILSFFQFIVLVLVKHYHQTVWYKKKSCKFKKSINKDKESHSLRKIWKKKKDSEEKRKKEIKRKSSCRLPVFSWASGCLCLLYWSLCPPCWWLAGAGLWRTGLSHLEGGWGI